VILGTDPVALDSVMLNHIIEEVKAQGDKAPKWLKDSTDHHEFLHYAMDVHRLGIHEHPPYKRIDYQVIEA
jgi:hypothetical protein